MRVVVGNLRVKKCYRDNSACSKVKDVAESFRMNVSVRQGCVIHNQKSIVQMWSYGSTYK